MPTHSYERQLEEEEKRKKIEKFRAAAKVRVRASEFSLLWVQAHPLIVHDRLDCARQQLLRRKQCARI